MDATELKRLAAENGFPAIPVAMPGNDDAEIPRFEGTLGEFWGAAKALEAKAVFLLVNQMDESDFERDVSTDDVPKSDEDDETFDGESYAVDLEEVSPPIAKFRKYVGKDCAIVLIAKGGVAELDFLITESWWDEFQEDADKAVESWVENRNEKFGEAEAEKQEKTGKLLQSLRGLINDREFCLLRTQSAKLAYAIEKWPELEGLSEFVLKPEIQKLQARIEAKGLNRKSRD